MKEILPIVDENDKIIDEIDKTEFDKTTGRIYRTVSLILFNLDGDFLIQRRSFRKLHLLENGKIRQRLAMFRLVKVIWTRFIVKLLKKLA